MLDTAQPLRFGVGPDTHALGLLGSEADGPLTALEVGRARMIAALVAGLPEDGDALVIVHSPSAVPLYRDAIRAMRGETLARSVRVVAAPTLRDERAIVPKGGLIPVFHDHMVQEQREHRRAIARAWTL